MSYYRHASMVQEARSLQDYPTRAKRVLAIKEALVFDARAKNRERSWKFFRKGSKHDRNTIRKGLEPICFAEQYHGEYSVSDLLAQAVTVEQVLLAIFGHDPQNDMKFWPEFHPKVIQEDSYMFQVREYLDNRD